MSTAVQKPAIGAEEKPATEAGWHPMRRSVKERGPTLRVPRLLLDRPSSIGKSDWARAFADLTNALTMVYEATNESASIGLVGTQRGWGSAALPPYQHHPERRSRQPCRRG